MIYAQVGMVLTSMKNFIANQFAVKEKHRNTLIPPPFCRSHQTTPPNPSQQTDGQRERDRHRDGKTERESETETQTDYESTFPHPTKKRWRHACKYSQMP